MDRKAIILANGLLNTDYAETSHGLIRGTERYELLAVIDPKSAGPDAGIVTDNIKHNIRETIKLLCKYRWLCRCRKVRMA